MTYGYARISTAKQNLERQIRDISEAYPEAHIITEVFTGTKISRPAFDKLLKVLKSGDTVVFESVSRMSRSAEEGFKLYRDLYEKGVTLVFINEPYVNTDTYRNSLQNAKSLELTGNEIADEYIKATNRVLLILAEQQFKQAFALSEAEIAHRSVRTKEGQTTARLNGKHIGREAGKTYTTEKELKAVEIIRKHSKSFGGSLEDSEVMELCKCSRNSYYKYKKIAREAE